jgi:hypothetical protein
LTSDRAKLGGTWRLKSFGGRALPANVRATMELGRFSNKATITTPGFLDQSVTHVLTGEYRVKDTAVHVTITRGDVHDTPDVAGVEDVAEISELTWSTLKWKVRKGRNYEYEVVWEKE